MITVNYESEKKKTIFLHTLLSHHFITINHSLPVYSFSYDIQLLFSTLYFHLLYFSNNQYIIFTSIFISLVLNELVFTILNCIAVYSRLDSVSLVIFSHRYFSYPYYFIFIDVLIRFESIDVSLQFPKKNNFLIKSDSKKYDNGNNHNINEISHF